MTGTHERSLGGSSSPFKIKQIIEHAKSIQKFKTFLLDMKVNPLRLVFDILIVNTEETLICNIFFNN